MAYDNGTSDGYCVHVYRYFCKKTMKYSPWYILYIRRPMRYLKIFSQWLWWRPVVNTKYNPNSPFLQNEKGLYICFIRRSPNLITIHHIRIYERVIQTPQRFIVEYFSSFDYNPNTTSDLFTHKRFINFPTQFIVNNYTQEFWFKNFSDGFPINL